MTDSTVQAEIETAMQIFKSEDRWECIQLYSADGLLLAGHGLSPVYSHDTLLEFNFSLIETLRLLGTDQPVKEIMIQGIDKRRLVFRFFQAWDETVVLAAILHTQKGYRRAMAKLIGLIQAIS
ncbi:hypothetical protein JW948_04935 [bacterium]|nr:hypothetical protein [bacterium]